MYKELPFLFSVFNFVYTNTSTTSDELTIDFERVNNSAIENIGSWKWERTKARERERETKYRRMLGSRPKWIMFLVHYLLFVRRKCKKESFSSNILTNQNNFVFSHHFHWSDGLLHLLTNWHIVTFHGWLPMNININRSLPLSSYLFLYNYMDLSFKSGSQSLSHMIRGIVHLVQNDNKRNNICLKKSFILLFFPPEMDIV